MNYEVVIRCYAYNHERYIEDALRGFVEQKTDFPFCAVVVDDFSTDDTASIIRRWQEQYPDIIKGVFLDHNHYQNGLSKEKYFEPFERDAKYVAMCEGDDCWCDPTKLQRQWEALEADGSLSVCFHRVRKIDREGRDLGKTLPKQNRFTGASRITLSELMREEFLLGRWTFQTSCFFFRKEMIALREELRSTAFRHYPYGDIPMVLTCLSVGDGAFIQEAMSCYRVASGGYMSQSAADPSLGKKRAQIRMDSAADLDEFFGGRFHAELGVFVKMMRINLCTWDLKIRYGKNYRRHPAYILNRLRWLLLRAYGLAWSNLTRM